MQYNNYLNVNVHGNGHGHNRSESIGGKKVAGRFKTEYEEGEGGRGRSGERSKGDGLKGK